MPVYTFYCNNCDHEFSKYLNFEDRDKEIFCSYCNSSDVKRVLNTDIEIETGKDYDQHVKSKLKMKRHVEKMREELTKFDKHLRNKAKEGFVDKE